MRQDAPFTRRRSCIVQKTLGAHWTRPAHISRAFTVVSSLIRDDVHLAPVRRLEATSSSPRAPQRTPWEKRLSRQARGGWVRMITPRPQDTAGSEDTARYTTRGRPQALRHWALTVSRPFTNLTCIILHVVNLIILRAVDLACVHEHGALYSIALCTSLRSCLRNSASWRAVVGWVRMTAFLSLLRDRILWPQTCGASRLRGTEIVFLQPAILTVIS